MNLNLTDRVIRSNDALSAAVEAELLLMKVWCMWLRRLLQRLLRLSWVEWKLLFEALMALAQARFLVRARAFPALAGRLGVHMQETGEADHLSRQPFLDSLSWGLRVLSRHLPWRCQCLEQALAAQLMLRRRNIPHTVYLGARLLQGQLQAHAWVRCGGYLVTGETAEAFPIVCCFAQRGTEA